MITSDDHQHEEEHRRLAMGGTFFMLYDSIRLLSNVTVVVGTPQDIQVAGVSGIPSEITGVFIHLEGANTAVNNALYARNVSAATANNAGHLICQAVNVATTGYWFVAVNSLGQIRLAAQGTANWTGVYLDIIGYVMQHPQHM